MPIPVDNSYFQKGTFDGFVAFGRCSVVESFRSWDLSAPPIGPIRGKHLAVIDDPHAVEMTDGRRIDPATGKVLPRPTDREFDADQAAQDAAAGSGPAITERIDHEYLDGNNKTTVGADGAWLECAGVTIKKGERLWFHWRFCRFDSMPYNDFALFLAYPDDDTRVAAAHRQLLCDVLTLERTPSLATGVNSNSNWSSPWTVGVFDPPDGFKGTLRWLASNGQSVSGVTSRRATRRFHRPSALLLDNFAIE